MADPFPTEFVRSLPKAELHVHLEGTADAKSVLALAERHGVRPPADDLDGVDAWYSFDDFPMFLERYFTVLDLLRTPADFALLAERYLGVANAQGVVHVEFHVSAVGHIAEQGKEWGPIYEGVAEGCSAGASTTGISWGLIPDVSPHLPAAQCIAAMEQVFNYDTEHVVAVGMGGPADRWFTEDFSPIFAKAADMGIPGVSHAAEHGGPEEVRFAIEQFGARRIQHGIGAMADPDVVSEARRRDVIFDVCPGSNLALKAVPEASAHPLCEMIRAGLLVTLATDDPPMFQTDLVSEYRRAWEWCDLDGPGIASLARNSIEASFANDEMKTRWLEDLEAQLGGWSG